MSALFGGSTTLTGKSQSGTFAPFLRPTKKRRPVHPLLLDRRGEKLICIRFVRCFTYTMPIPDCGEQARLKWLLKISAVASMPLFLHIIHKTKIDRRSSFAISGTGRRRPASSRSSERTKHPGLVVRYDSSSCIKTMSYSSPIRNRSRRPSKLRYLVAFDFAGGIPLASTIAFPF
ncbi:hypothetical protein Taro_041007 [Colocasia esculenta]|uniref:Uncharacterized protein n=1 Tax=Colocasia esculenta TaxID=4460 RepID=A0A843WS44_COLES|nr:hypothetical protein [Colocasia esculenta]